MIIKSKLAVKMSLHILTGVLVVFMFIIEYNYRISRKIVLKEVKMTVYNQCQSTFHQVENLLLPAQEIPNNLSFIIGNSAFTKERLEGLMKILVKNNPGIFGSCVAFEPYSFMESTEYYAPYIYRSGDSLITTDLGKNGYNYTDRDWYRQPREKGAGWGEPYFDKGGGNIFMLTYSAPFTWKNNGKFRGTVTVDLSLENLSTLISRIKIYETGYAFLISPSGTYISHPDPSVEVKETIFSYAEKHGIPDLAAIGHEMVKGMTGFRRYHSTLIDKDCWLYYTSPESNRWSLAVVIPEDEILADIYVLHRQIFLFGLIGFLIILVIIVIISRRITTPLVKLAATTRLIGSGNFDVKIPRISSRDEIGELSDSFIQMQSHLREYIQNLKEVTAARQKMQSELKIARDIQQNIIPKTFPPFPRRKEIDIHAVLIPAREVGGDMYDYFFIEDDILAIAVGDVSGKGIPSALFMAITRTLFRARTLKNMKASEIVRDMNSGLCSDNDNAMFVTFFLGLLHLKTGEMEYCNAGHIYPFILRENGKIMCLEETHGMPLGLSSATPYGCSSMRLQSGDRLVFYTDGVSEAMDKDGDFYGDERLKEILSGPCSNLGVRDITRYVLDDMAEFTKEAEQSDDITLLVLSYHGMVKNPKTRMLKREITILNDLDELERLNAFLEDIGEEWSIASEMLFQIKLAAEEVVSNVIRHGYKGLGAGQKIMVEIFLLEGHLKIRITDHGVEFNPLKVPPPDDLDKPLNERKIGGLGVYFIRQMMDQVEYCRENGSNILILTKKISDSMTGRDDDRQ